MMPAVLGHLVNNLIKTEVLFFTKVIVQVCKPIQNVKVNAWKSFQHVSDLEALLLIKDYKEFLNSNLTY